MAVVCEAAAAWMMARWVRRLGAPPGAANQVMWLTALGAGSLYTLFDPHTADPLMHVLAPASMLLLFNSRIGVAVGVAAVGIFAKEFAAVPLCVAGLTWCQQRRWREAGLALFGLLIVIGLWAVWMVWLRMTWGYSYGGNQSANLLGGGFLLFWMSKLPVSVIVGSIVMALGVLWILWPVGLFWGPPPLRHLTLATLPCLLLWCYVQQPDRALWNFAFAAMPAAAVVFAKTSPLVGWSVVAAQAIMNLRFGAQLTFIPPARFALVLVLAIGLAAVWQGAMRPRPRLATNGF